MDSWHEPTRPTPVYWELWQGTSNPYALLAWGRSLDVKVNRVFRKVKV